MDNLRIITNFVNEFFFYYIVTYGTILFMSAIYGSIKMYMGEKLSYKKNRIKRDYYIPVSIIVPAYNEEVTITSTIDSLLNLDYKLYEIIIVNDGSKDNTLNKLIEKYNLKKTKKIIKVSIPTKKICGFYETKIKNIHLIVVDKINGGKSDALNTGINVSKYPYVLTIDADTLLAPNALTELSSPIFVDSATVAVGGIIKLQNETIVKKGKIVGSKLPKKLIEILQVLEYDRTFLAGRIIFDSYNGNLIISGAFGLFKKDLVIRIGGYKNNTIGEDMELVIRLHKYCLAKKIPYKIKYSTKAVSYTQAPNNIKDIKKQRKRWHLGLMQSLYTHKDMLFNIKYGLLGFISFPYYLLYELLSPITECIGLIFIFIAYYIEMINIKVMLSYLLVYVMFCSIFTITTFFIRTYTSMGNITFKELIKICFYSFIENLGFRQLINLFRLEAFFTSKRNRLSWGSIRRKKI